MMRNDDNRKRNYICMMLAVLIAGVFTGLILEKRICQVDAKIDATQQKLASEVLRFHVLANSDRDEDQALKLKVKEHLISYMKRELPNAQNVKETKTWVRCHEKELEQEARRILRENGSEDLVEAELAKSYFPEKTYGDVTFPKGTYEALRIKIGKAKGQNWWCVLYPNLCFVDAIHAVVPEEGKEELAMVLDEEEYEMVTATSKFKIKWFFFGKDTD